MILNYRKRKRMLEYQKRNRMMEFQLLNKKLRNRKKLRKRKRIKDQTLHHLRRALLPQIRQMMNRSVKYWKRKRNKLNKVNCSMWRFVIRKRSSDGFYARRLIITSKMWSWWKGKASKKCLQTSLKSCGNSKTVQMLNQSDLTIRSMLAQLKTIKNKKDALNEKMVVLEIINYFVVKIS